MKRGIKIILISLVFILVCVGILYSTGVLRGYYYDTDMTIGNKKVYSYNEITFSEPKCINRLYFYDDDNFKYYVDKSGCSKEVYYIKEDGKYIDLESALDNELITSQQILNSDLKITKEEK